jgi:hypothetical protein
MPQPSVWWSVRPPRWANPVKLKVTSVGVLQFIPSSWHMALFWTVHRRNKVVSAAEAVRRGTR